MDIDILHMDDTHVPWDVLSSRHTLPPFFFLRSPSGRKQSNMDTDDRNSGNMAQGSKFNLIRVFCLYVCVLGGSVQLFLLLLLMFETRSHSIGLAGLELTIETVLSLILVLDEKTGQFLPK